jgi:hypothetical protein
MNTKQQDLFSRLENALDNISKSPKTAVEVTMIFEGFVASFEEIAEDLSATPDEQTAKALREIIHGIISTSDSIPIPTGQLATNP